MASLYQIRNEIENFEFALDPDTGEILNATTWDDLTFSYDEKVENIACYVKNLTSDIAAFKAEEEALAKRRKAKERKRDYWKQVLTDNMRGEKFSTAKCAVSFRRSEQIIIPDENAVPAEFRKESVTYTPDKMAIKTAIKAGREIAGCQLVENLNVQIK